MLFVNDEIVEVRLESGGCPALFGRPACGSVCDREAANAGFKAQSGAAEDQDVAVWDDGRLHDAVSLPRVLPEQLAVGRGDANHAISVQWNENLEELVTA